MRSVSSQAKTNEAGLFVPNGQFSHRATGGSLGMSGSPKAYGLNGLKQKKGGFVVTLVHSQRKWVNLGLSWENTKNAHFQTVAVPEDEIHQMTGTPQKKLSILIPIFNLNLTETTFCILWYSHLQPQMVGQR